LVGVVALVVRVQLDRRPQDLVVALVALDNVDRHGDRLLALLGDDDALAHLRAAGTVLGGLLLLTRRRGLAGLGLLGLDPGAVRATLLGEGGAALAALGVPLLGRARLALAGRHLALGALGLELLAARRARLRGSLLRRLLSRGLFSLSRGRLLCGGL